MKKTSPTRFSLPSVLENGEDYKTEFKQKAEAGLDREITAFANSSGGKIYIGITDEGKIKGVNITNRLKSRIEDIAKNCDPKIPISIQALKKEKVLIVEVPESKDKPHRCFSGFYIRSGASSQKLSRNEIWEFMKDEELFEFDTRLCKKFIFKKHFDKKKLFFFLDKAKMKYSKRNYAQLLENLEVAEKKDSKIVFNNAGALFFSKNLNQLISHAEISCALFKGTDKFHDIIDRKIFNRDIINNIEDSVSFLKKHLRLEYHFPKGQLQRKEVLEIPEEALREALVNAVTHRNYLEERVSVTVEIYDDRVEIYNFGGLPKGLKRSEFGKKSVPRNKLIASLMLRTDYIEKMGTGIKKMRSLIKKAGLKPIKFNFTDFTTLTFYRKPLPGGYVIKSPEIVAMENLSEMLSKNFGLTIKRASKIIKILRSIEIGIFNIDSLSKTLGVSSRSIEKDIELLKKQGFIQFEGSRKTGKYKPTEKYKKLKEKYKLKSNALKVRNKSSE